MHIFTINCITVRHSKVNKFETNRTKPNECLIPENDVRKRKKSCAQLPTFSKKNPNNKHNVSPYSVRINLLAYFDRYVLRTRMSKYTFSESKISKYYCSVFSKLCAASHTLCRRLRRKMICEFELNGK